MSPDWERRLSTLRSEFDEAFADAPRSEAETEDFLSLRVAGETVAVRLADVSRIGKSPSIAPVPTRRASVLGVASFRGALVPVHSLAVLLGRTPRTHDWLAVVRGTELALAFDALAGFVRAPRGTADVLRDGEGATPIVDLRGLARSLAGENKDRQGD